MSQKITKHSILKLAKMGMLTAISVALVAIIRFPIFPSLNFLEYDPADVSILIGTFAFGPIAGLILTVVTSLIQGFTVSAGGGPYGIIMHIIATSALVLVSGIIYRLHKTRRSAIIGLACGTIAMALIMIPANLIITPIYWNTPKDVIWGLMPLIVGFNLIKAGVNGAITFLLYKRISAFLHK